MLSKSEALPIGIRREYGRNTYLVEVRVRPYPKRRKRFPRDTPLETMVAWREAQHAELFAQRDALFEADRAAYRMQIEDVQSDGHDISRRVANALERIATALERGRAANDSLRFF